MFSIKKHIFSVQKESIGTELFLIRDLFHYKNVNKRFFGKDANLILNHFYTFILYICKFYNIYVYLFFLIYVTRPIDEHNNSSINNLYNML